MSDWGGIIGGALRGAGTATADIADGMIKNERQVELENERSKILEQRELRLNEARERLRRSGNEYDFQQDQVRAPIKNQMEADRIAAVEPAKTAAELDRVRAVDPEKARIARESRIAEKTAELGFETKTVGERAKNSRAMANATHFNDDAAGQKLRNELTQEQINDRQEIRDERKAKAKIMDEYNAAIDNDDKTAADKAQKKLAAHNRRFGRDDTKDWTLKKDEENGGYFEYNQKTAEMRKVDTANLPTRSNAGGAQPEIRYSGTEAYIRGPDGKPKRAMQYDKK